MLPRVDKRVSQYGVHHQTGLLACQIIANNASNGYLENEKRQPVTTLQDDILVDEVYYFVVPGQDDYPIVPSFQDWEFLHSRSYEWPEISSDKRPEVRCTVTQNAHATYLA
ncbi:hypothetical protein BGZ63DRAFT_391469 [Mariannaea sp. PMI_226]|nr:hypothetical protein BGZ63DRAFT_391469 [Mariannaea sp. PMI_226]